jgi:hypothetical protein
MVRTKRLQVSNEKVREAIHVIRKDYSRLEHFPQFRDDEEFIMTLISNHWMPGPFQTEPQRQREWRHFVENPQDVLLEWATDRFRQDESLARRIVSTNWRALPHVNPVLRSDREVILSALS